jgi:hypothetical protein
MIQASHNEASLLIAIAAQEAAEDIVGRVIRSAIRPEAASAGSSPLPPDADWANEQFEIYRELYEAISTAAHGLRVTGIDCTLIAEPSLADTSKTSIVAGSCRATV